MTEQDINVLKKYYLLYGKSLFSYGLIEDDIISVHEYEEAFGEYFIAEIYNKEYLDSYSCRSDEVDYHQHKETEYSSSWSYSISDKFIEEFMDVTF